MGQPGQRDHGESAEATAPCESNAVATAAAVDVAPGVGPDRGADAQIWAQTKEPKYACQLKASSSVL